MGRLAEDQPDRNEQQTADGQRLIEVPRPRLRGQQDITLAGHLLLGDALPAFLGNHVLMPNRATAGRWTTISFLAHRSRQPNPL